MKKILTFIASACIALISFTNASAASFSASLTGNSQFTDPTTLTLSVGGYSGIDMSFGGLMVVTMNLNYDSSKIDVSTSALNGFNLTSGARILLDRADGVVSGTEILSLTITNKALSNGESTTISLSNIKGSDSTNDALAASVSKTITYKAPAPEPNPNPSPAPEPNPAPAPNSAPAQNPRANQSTTTDTTNDKIEQTQNIEDKSNNDKNIVVSEQNKNDQNTQQEQKNNFNILPIIAAVVILIIIAVIFVIIKKKK